MRIVAAARDCAVPDWLVGAGAIRDLVWDALHDRPPAPPKDVDVAFFDPTDLTPERDRRATAALAARLAGVPWEATNQAAVHTWYERTFGNPVEPLVSSADGVATWPETATCVAVRLDRRDRIEVVAPYGLDDLLGLVLRRNARRVTAAEYRRRAAEKRIAERWPRVAVLPA
jgi:hypothetical protein